MEQQKVPNVSAAAKGNVIDPGQLAPPPTPLVEATAPAPMIVANNAPVGQPNVGVPKDSAPPSVYLWHVHEYLNGYIRFADSKAGAVIVFNSGMVAAMFAAKLHKRLMQAAPATWGSLEWLTVAAFALLVIGIVLAVWTIMPRLADRPQKGFIFWERVASHGNEENFWSAIQGQSEAGLAEHTAHHVYSLSRVAKTKYMLVRLSMLVGFFGAITAAVVLLWT